LVNTPPVDPLPENAAASSSEAPPPVSNAAGQKTWSVGTLTYTSAGLVTLFFLLLAGDFAWSMRDRSAGPMAQWYLGHLKVPNYVFGLLLTSFPALVGLILGPIISVKSDRHRGKWGRRIPFLLVTTPLAAFGMIGLGLTPVLAKWLHSLGTPGHPFGAWLHETLGGSALGGRLLSLVENEMVVSVVCFAVFWAAFELATIAGQSVFGGLINDVVPHSLMGRFYGFFRAVSLIDGMIFNYWIMGRVPEYFTLILICIGVFYGAAFLWVCLKVKEGEYPPPPPVMPGKAGRIAEVKGYFKESFSRPYYVFVFIMLMTGSLCFMPVNAFSIPYAESVGMSMTTYGHCLALTYAFSLCLSFLLGWLADKFHPIRTSMASIAGYIVVSGLGMMFATTPERFAITFVAHGIIAGCYFTSAASLGQRLFPQSKYAQFASAGGIIASLGTMAIGPAVGSLIDLTGRVYRYTFLAGCIMSAVALIAAWIVYGHFKKLGGPTGYVAPE
jgi:MFS family permease